MRHHAAFHQKIIIITGAASGIGKALAQSLNAERAKLYLLDLNKKGLQELSESLKKNKSECLRF